MKGGIALSEKTNVTKPAFYYSMFHGKNIDFLHVSLYTLTTNKIRTLHFHRVIEIGKCIKGSGMCYLNDKEIPFSEGDIQIIRPYDSHYDTYNTPGTLWYFITIDIQKINSQHFPVPLVFLSDLIQHQIKSGVYSPTEYPKIDQTITNLIELYNSNEINSFRTDSLALQVYSLLLECSRLGTNTAPVPPKSNSQIKKIFPALKLVSTAIKQGSILNIEDMALACNMSQSHFRKIFLEIMNETPKNYFDRLQMEKAAEMILSTDLSLSEIAFKIGIDEASTFYRKFTKYYGCSPIEFKKKNL